MVVNNPNNWHWVDKNCIDWTKKYFKEEFDNYSVEYDEKVKLIIPEVRSIEGDVEVCQRKGKVISLYDLKIVYAIKAIIGDDEYTGSITVPEVAYDTEEDEFQFNINLDKDDNNSSLIKKSIRKALEPELRKKLIKFGKDLITTHGNDIQLSEDKVTSEFTKSNQKASVTGGNVLKVTTKAAAPVVKSEAKLVSKSSTSSSIPKYNTSTLHIETNFTTTAEEIFKTLIEPERITFWTRAGCDVEPKEGGKYTLFHGNIEGKFLKFTNNEKIEMLWRLKEWKADYYANLTISLFQGDSDTKMDVMFKGIPIGEEEKVESNFQEYYIRAIKISFGFGIVL